MPNKTPKDQRSQPILEAILDHFGSQIRFLCILFVLIYMLVFGIARGRSPVAILMILVSFQDAFWGHFAHVVADAAKLKECKREIYVFGNVGPPVLHNLLLVFCSCFSVCWGRSGIHLGALWNHPALI